MSKFIDSITKAFKETVEDTRDKFNKFDDDGSGNLDTGELSKLMSLLGYKMNDQAM
jgi:Ca2+-binding EF-hand superfamily protein